MESIGDFLKTQKLDEKLEKGLKAGIEAGLKEGFGEEQVDAFVKKVASLIKDNNMTVEKALSVANVPNSVKDTISMKVDGNGNVYGYYCSEFYSDKGTIPDYATEIKLSEYYAAVEAYEAEVKAK